jgi:hypothetical protein
MYSADREVLQTTSAQCRQPLGLRHASAAERSAEAKMRPVPRSSAVMRMTSRLFSRPPYAQLHLFLECRNRVLHRAQ